MYNLLIFGLLGAIWIVFSGQFDAFHLTLGILSAFLVVRFSGDLLFKDRAQRFSERLRQGRLLIAYSFWLLIEVILANLHVLRLALHPRGPEEVDPSVIRFKTSLRGDFAIWLLANSITLTPGTVTIKVDGDELHIHAISLKTAEGLGHEMERRIARIYEPQANA